MPAAKTQRWIARTRDQDRFDIPSQQERTSLSLGSRVKLLFLILGRDEDGDFIQCERMWVTVVEVNEKRYVGVLESLPAASDVLSPGDRIAFAPEHVATILMPSPQPPTA